MSSPRRARRPGGSELSGALRAQRSRSRAGHDDTLRIDYSIRLPWGVGLAALLVLALATAILVARTPASEFHVPRAMLDAQEALTVNGAQTARRSLNAGVADLDELSRHVALSKTSNPARVERALRAAMDTHKRYRSLYAIDGARHVLARVGRKPHLDLLEKRPLRAPGTQDAVAAGRGSLVAIQYAPPARAGGYTLVGEYDLTVLRGALEGAEPGDAWIVNGRGDALLQLTGPAQFVPLPRPELRGAARKVTTGRSGALDTGGSLDRRQMVAFAPIEGRGPAARLGWGVVTERAISSISLPHTDARREALLVGAVLAMLAALIFGWLYIIVIKPLAQLQHEAERLAHGDLSRTVQVVRYDEIGLTARALERLRIALIRQRARGARSEDER
jgi:HAMP domain-containing protein